MLARLRFFFKESVFELEQRRLVNELRAKELECHELKRQVDVQERGYEASGYRSGYAVRKHVQSSKLETRYLSACPDMCPVDMCMCPDHCPEICVHACVLFIQLERGYDDGVSGEPQLAENLGGPQTHYADEDDIHSIYEVRSPSYTDPLRTRARMHACVHAHGTE